MSSLISIIVPVYKAELYIRKCIDSILTQKLTDFELLLVDDGSPDNCGEICDEYAERDARVRVFHKENEGVSKARNFALNHARGNYVCFIDSDDWVDVGMLETIMCWEQEKQMDLLFYGFQYETSTGCFDRLDLLHKISGKYEGADSVIKACYLLEINGFLGWTCNKLFRNSIIQKFNIRFNEEISIQEDHIFTLEYLKYVTCLAVYSYAPYHYRVIDGSLMNKKYPYKLCKLKSELLFNGRMALIDRVKNKNETKSYRQYSVHNFLSTLFYFYRISLHEDGDNPNETEYIRMVIRKYACESWTIKVSILYIFSFFPNNLFNTLLKLYVRVKI